MKKKEEKAVFKAAIEAFGVPNQFQQVLEEMSELAIEIHKIRRNRNTGVYDLASELADVYIMLDQIKVIYGSEFVNDVKSIREAKIKRLLERIVNHAKR